MYIDRHASVLIFVGIIAVSNSQLFAQHNSEPEITSRNLVLNGSFEENLKCPSESFDIKQSKYWSSPIEGTTPEYVCYSCPMESTDFPTTPFGNCYIRLISRMAGSYTSQEYIQGELSTPLKKDSTYRFSFYYRKEDLSKYYMDRWSILFSSSTTDYEIKVKKMFKIISSKDAVCIRVKNFSEHKNWCLLEGVYVAKGGETQITIGVVGQHMNRGYKNEKKFVVDPKMQGTVCHYYIDNICVFPAN